MGSMIMVEIGGRDAQQLRRSVMMFCSRASMELPVAFHYTKNGPSSLFLPLDGEDIAS
jgi:hypothetical protein